MDQSPPVGAHAGRAHSYPATDQETVFEHGVLHVQVYMAQDIRGDEFKGLGKADPYLRVKHGNLHKPVILLSHPQQDAGSNPIFCTDFSFPLRNGGTKDHNIVEIEICNKNRRTGFLRGDNILGHVRLGGLADWITSKDHSITELLWYPVFYRHKRRSKDQTVKRGEILMKFSFEQVNEEIFRLGERTEPKAEQIRSENRPDWSEIGKAEYRREVGGRFSAMVGGLGAILIPLLVA